MAGNKYAREGFIIAGFLALTSLMTWPWVTRLRDACADPGDPYLLSWVLWWDYHQTFTSPLHLFDANIFYPLRQTLAFSENDYGIALLFFPLFALGFQPLTVNSIATFLGFAFCGYGAFRLTRTLTGSTGAAWIAGIFFAFLPYRFHLLSQVHYVFAGWIPLTLEALILFARERSRKRAVWLGIAFTMNGLSCLSWLVLSSVPLVLSLAFLLIRYQLLRDRKFWLRGVVAAGASGLALLPFMLPYLRVSKTYGFSWGPEVVARTSPTALRWVVAEYRNLLWKGLGDNVPGGGPKLFPGLLAPLLALAALFLPAWGGSSLRNSEAETTTARKSDEDHGPVKWVVALDAVAIVGAIFVVLSLGWAGSTSHPFLGRFFAGATLYRSIYVLVAAVLVRSLIRYPAFLRRVTGAKSLINHLTRPERTEPLWRRGILVIASLAIWISVIAAIVLFLFDWTGGSGGAISGKYLSGPLDQLRFVFAVAVIARFSFAYPGWLRRATGAGNLIEHIREARNGDALWLGAIWATTGFLMSLGTNSWFYRILYDLVFLFRGMREPSRAAMMASLGLAVLAGVGSMKIAHALARRRQHVRPAMVLCVIVIALLFELRAAPLPLFRGAAYPDELTLRLKQTPMRGGLVELPTGNGILPHLYMLRAADHEKPLINAISTFVPQHAWEIESMSKAAPIPGKLLDAMEKVPTSYLVIHSPLIEPERRPVYEAFLSIGVATGRLRFIKRYGAGDDLYAVVKTEPEIKSEAELPFALKLNEWAALISNDPVNMLGQHREWMQTLYRIHLVSTQTLPRYKEFLEDAKRMSAGVVFGEEDQRQLEQNLRDFAATWIERPAFKSKYNQLTNEDFVDQLFRNAGVSPDQQERNTLSQSLSQGQLNRADVLLRVVQNESFKRKEHHRSLVVLHYFGYLRRNPDDLPDGNLNGMRHWLNAVERSGDISRLSVAFKASFEYEKLHQKK
ncbi:MAG TPA: DUF4214 domain-containing protein [Pyrinomonadaceae bacterium]|nr:DUF4214 domain-containing protein [Pyrinomonadaceae bacterium]